MILREVTSYQKRKRNRYINNIKCISTFFKRKYVLRTIFLVFRRWLLDGRCRDETWRICHLSWILTSRRTSKERSNNNKK